VAQVAAGSEGVGQREGPRRVEDRGRPEVRQVREEVQVGGQEGGAGSWAGGGPEAGRGSRPRLGLPRGKGPAGRGGGREAGVAETGQGRGEKRPAERQRRKEGPPPPERDLWAEERRPDQEKSPEPEEAEPRRPGNLRSPEEGPKGERRPQKERAPAPGGPGPPTLLAGEDLREAEGRQDGEGNHRQLVGMEGGG